MARLSCSEQSLNDVIFIWYTDGKVFSLATLQKNSQNNRLDAPAATKKKSSDQNAFFDIQSVADGVSGHIKIELLRFDNH